VSEDALFATPKFR